MSIEIIDLLKPKNGLSFKLIEDIDIAVQGYTSLADAVSHFVTTENIQQIINAALSGKQDTLSSAQLAACNSGITSELVAQIGANTSAIAGKASQADLTAATASLQTQMDAVAQSVGSGTADTEIAQARVDAEGTVHTTLKDRIDSTEDRLEELSEATAVYIEPINWYNPATSTANKYLKTDGTLGDADGKYTSDYIPVKPNDSLAYILNQQSASTINATCAYDASKNFLEFKQYKMYTAPIGAAYIRFTTTTTPSTPLMLTRNSDVVIYQPYFAPYIDNPASIELEGMATNDFGVSFEDADSRIANIEKLTLREVKSTNMFNSATAVDGYSLNSSTGELVEQTGRTVSDYIPVTPGMKMITGYNGQSATVYLTCGYDQNKGFVTYQQYTMYTVPAGVYYVRISFITTEKDKFMVNQGEIRLPYEPYFDPIYTSTSAQNNIVTVGAGKQFSTLRAAIDSINNSSKSNPYYIHIYEGTYNVMEDYTAEEINSAYYESTADSFVGLELTDGMHLIGIGDADKIIINGELSTSDYAQSVRIAISTINTKGNCSIENVTIQSKNLRYPIHDDFAVNANCVHEYRNCVIKNVIPIGTQTAGYGLGSKSGMKVNIYDCLISTNMTYHNGGGFSQPSIVNMYNSAVTGNITLGDYYNQNINCLLNLYGTSYSSISRYWGEGTEHAETLLVNDYIHGINPTEKALLDSFAGKTLTFNQDGSITWTANE